MKGEYGHLPASLSASQSAHAIGCRVGSAAASSLTHTHTHTLSNPQNTAYSTAVLLQATSHPPAPQNDIGIIKTPQIWSKRSGDLTQSFSLVECGR